jgi:hypothetical protein
LTIPQHKNQSPKKLYTFNHINTNHQSLWDWCKVLMNEYYIHCLYTDHYKKGFIITSTNNWVVFCMLFHIAALEHLWDDILILTGWSALYTDKWGIMSLNMSLLYTCSITEGLSYGSNQWNWFFLKNNPYTSKLLFTMIKVNIISYIKI